MFAAKVKVRCGSSYWLQKAAKFPPLCKFADAVSAIHKNVTSPALRLCNYFKNHENKCFNVSSHRILFYQLRGNKP